MSVLPPSSGPKLCQDTQHKTQQDRTQPTNPNIYAHREDLKHIWQHKQQQTTAVSSPKILTPDDDHIGRNM
jgi:hypothetical protein